MLEGIDALIFSGGVGENPPEVRNAACKQLTFLGLKLEDAANEQLIPDRDIAAPDSTLRVLIIRAQEDSAIARECWRVMRSSHE
jgi:acetate kinase